MAVAKTEKKNQKTEKHAGGRPAYFTDIKTLKAKINEYFEWVKGEKKEEIDFQGDIYYLWIRDPEPLTVTGLAIFLGFESRQSLYDYSERSDKFSFLIKAARLRVENKYEKNLHGTTPTGSIFALKNMGWKDQYQNELTGKDGLNLFQNKSDDELIAILNASIKKATE